VKTRTEQAALQDPTNKPCDELAFPVRAEDGKIYRNECEAQVAGRRGPFKKVSMQEYEAELTKALGSSPRPSGGSEAPNRRVRAASPDGGMRPETARASSVEDILKAGLGESQAYGGWWAPTINKVKMQGGTGGIPFRTKAAEKVYAFAKKIVLLYPEASGSMIKKDAMNRAEVLATELTPEDEALLDIAINWAQTGRADDVISAPIVNLGLNGKGSDIAPRGYR
jgi:hypothetical protein